MTTKKVIVLRTFENDKQTLGTISVTDGNGVIFVARTLELPDKNNKNNISCIIPGKYLCKYTLSPSFNKKTYEITSVPGRAGVRIHSGNYYSQVRGCILLGNAHKDINADKELDVIHSGDTLKEFERIMNYEDFELRIIDCTD